MARGTLNFRGERLGDFFAVHRLDHIEKGDGIMRFIGLQGSDEVEFEAGMARLERRPFLQRLLDPVFAENPLSGADHGRNVLRGKGFGDADKSHVLRLASGVARGACDAGAHQGEALDGRRGRFFALLQSFGLSISAARPSVKTAAARGAPDCGRNPYKLICLAALRHVGLRGLNATIFRSISIDLIGMALCVG